MYGYMYWKIGREERISKWAQCAFRCLPFINGWVEVFLTSEKRVVALDMRMARMGVSLDFDLLTWEQQIPLFTSWKEN